MFEIGERFRMFAAVVLGLSCWMASCAGSRATPDESVEMPAPTAREVHVVFKRHTGRELDESWCITRPESIENVAVAGFDRNFGCTPQFFIIDGRGIKRFDRAVEALQERWNWSTLEAGERKRRARMLVEDVRFGLGYDVVQSEQLSFAFEDTPEFRPVETTVRADGTPVVRLWLRRKSGSSGAVKYDRVEYRFPADSTYELESLEMFTVEPGRLRAQKDLPSDEEINRIYGEMTGDDSLEAGCIERPPHLERVVVVASFIHDYGCKTTGVFIEREPFDGVEEAAVELMRRWEWSTLARSERERRGRMLVRELFHAFGPSIVGHEKKAFKLEDTPDFRRPESDVDAGGDVQVRVWLQSRPGMSADRGFGRFQYTFTSDGEFEKELVDKFSVHKNRLYD